MITAILNNKMDKVEYVQDSIFGLDIPTSLDGIPNEVLNPRQMWDDKNQYDTEALNLSNLFKKNFEKYGNSLDHLKEFGPK